MFCFDRGTPGRPASQVSGTKLAGGAGQGGPHSAMLARVSNKQPSPGAHAHHMLIHTIESPTSAPQQLLAFPASQGVPITPAVPTAHPPALLNKGLPNRRACLLIGVLQGGSERRVLAQHPQPRRVCVPPRAQRKHVAAVRTSAANPHEHLGLPRGSESPETINLRSPGGGSDRLPVPPTPTSLPEVRGLASVTRKTGQ